MKTYDPHVIAVLQALVDAVGEECDMDAVSPKLGQAMNMAQDVLDDESSTRRADVYTDQSRW
jgi:hypothetical protein